MKTPAIAVLTSLSIATVLAADLVITSFDTNGTLTWTNSVSNATYRVEWASAVTGPWTNFQALTKLDFIQSTGTTATVKVPMFYRVETAEQNAEGIYLYKGYDAEGGLLNVGWLSLERRTDIRRTNIFKGTWALGYAGRAVNVDLWKTYGIQFGEGQIEAGFEKPPTLRINLNPNTANENVFLVGSLESNNYRGTWLATFFGPKTNGTFTAEKVTDFPR